MKDRKTLLALCYFVLMLPIGAWYSVCYADFGKAIVGGWGLFASCLAAIGAISVRSGWKKTADWCGALLTALQVLPACCWGVFVSQQFAGVPGWLGLTIHVIMLIWGFMNIADSIRKK